MSKGAWVTYNMKMEAVSSRRLRVTIYLVHCEKEVGLRGGSTRRDHAFLGSAANLYHAVRGAFPEALAGFELLRREPVGADLRRTCAITLSSVGPAGIPSLSTIVPLVDEQLSAMFVRKGKERVWAWPPTSSAARVVREIRAAVKEAK